MGRRRSIEARRREVGDVKGKDDNREKGEWWTGDGEERGGGIETRVLPKGQRWSALLPRGCEEEGDHCIE